MGIGVVVVRRPLVIAAITVAMGAGAFAIAAPGSADTAVNGPLGPLPTFGTTTTIDPCLPSADGVTTASSTSTSTSSSTTTSSVAAVPVCASTTTTTAPSSQSPAESTTTTTVAGAATATSSTTTSTTTPAQNVTPARTGPAVPDASVTIPAGGVRVGTEQGDSLGTQSLNALSANGVSAYESSGSTTQAAPAGASSVTNLSLSPAVIGGAQMDEQAPSVAAPQVARSSDLVLSMISTLNLSDSARARLFAPFPLAGPASYDGRGGAGGTDIRTTDGTPVVASGAGRITVSGDVITLSGPDGTVFTYSGVQAAPAVQDQAVTEGDILGRVHGDAPVVRFSVRMHGQPADAAPFLDRWLAQALHTAQGMRQAALSPRTPSTSKSSGWTALASTASHLAEPGGTPASPIPAVVVIGAAAAWVVRRRRRALAGLGHPHRDGGGRGATRTTRTFDRQ